MAAPKAGIAVRSLGGNSLKFPTAKATWAGLVWQLGRCDYHVSPSLSKMKSGARLEKILLKKKKKFYYNPMNTAELGKLDIGASGGKSKYRNEDSIRLRAYNKILHESISDMLSGNTISEELGELQLTVLGVRVSGDMSACRVYWMSTGTVEEDDRIEGILNHHKGPLRRALISHRVLGKIPPVVFLKDKATASVAEIERLLAKADFGPEEEEEEVEEGALTEEDREADAPEPGGRMEFIRETGKTGSPRAALHQPPPLPPQPSLFGIDHAAVNQMIQAGRTSSEPPPAVVGGGRPGDRTGDRQFQEFRAFLERKKRLGKAGRKLSAHYQGELETQGAAGSEEIHVPNDDLADAEDFGQADSRYYDDEEEFEENGGDVDLQNDDLPPSDQQTRDK